MSLLGEIKRRKVFQIAAISRPDLSRIRSQGEPSEASMKKRMSIMKCASAFIAATTLLWAASLGLAHHSPSNYDLGQVIEIEGEITRVLWRNPHVRIWIMPVGETDEEAVCPT